MNRESPLYLLVVADDPFARAGLAALLDEMPDCVVVGQVESDFLPADVAADFEPLPDVLVWDVGWEAPEQTPDWVDTAVPVIALVNEETAVAALWGAGVSAVLRREREPEQIAAAAQAAAEGLLVLDPDLAEEAGTAVSRDAAPLLEDLTPRELEVLQLLAEGLTNKGIAQRLAISDHTVKFHVNAILTKLNAQSRTEAVVRATRLGLILL